MVTKRQLAFTSKTLAIIANTVIKQIDDLIIHVESYQDSDVQGLKVAHELLDIADELRNVAKHARRFSELLQSIAK